MHPCSTRTAPDIHTAVMAAPYTKHTILQQYCWAVRHQHKERFTYNSEQNTVNGNKIQPRAPNQLQSPATNYSMLWPKFSGNGSGFWNFKPTHMSLSTFYKTAKWHLKHTHKHQQTLPERGCSFEGNIDAPTRDRLTHLMAYSILLCLIRSLRISTCSS